MFSSWGPIIAITALAVANVIAYRRTKLVLSPFSIMSIAFFLPLILATLRLSTLQSQSWSDDTIVMLSTSVICWGLVPFFVSLKTSANAHQGNTIKQRIEQLPRYFVSISRGLSGAFIAAFFAENYVLSGSLFPFLLGGNTLHELHTQSLPAIGLLTKGNVAIVLIAYVSIVRNNALLDRIALPIVLFLPAMRGSRIDIFVALIALAVAYGTVNTRTQRSFFIRGLIAAVGLSIAGGNLAEYRASQGQYEISLAANAGLAIEKSNLFSSTLSQLFSNFVLPFENLDRLIRKYPDPIFFGELTLASPIMSALFEADRFIDLKLATDIEKYGYRDPTTPTGVGTALGAFYLDFGPIGAAVPMLFYAFMWIYFYHRSNKNVLAFLLYCLYSAFFSLTAFQPIMATGKAIRLMIIVSLPFILIKFLAESGYIKKRRRLPGSALNMPRS